MATKPRSRRVAWVALGVLIVASALAAPAAWELIRYRAVERVYWPDGHVRLEFKWPRWGERVATLTSWSPGGTEWRPGQGVELRGDDIPPILSATVRGDDGRYETFVFPGNRGTPDLRSEREPTRRQIQVLRTKRLVALTKGS